MSDLYRPIEMSELYVGCKLICLHDSINGREKMGCYSVTGARDFHNVFIDKDDAEPGGWLLFQLNNHYDCIAFLPFDRLTEKEQFMFHMTGKLP